MTAKDSNFFEEITQTINTLISSGASIEYCKKLNECGIYFNEEGENGLKELNNFLMQKQISHLIVPEETILSAIKVYRVHKNDDSYLFKKLSDLLQSDLQQNTINTFNSPNYKLLIIECKSPAKGIVIDKLYEELSKILSSNSFKKIILIAKENDSLANKFKTDVKHKI